MRLKGYDYSQAGVYFVTMCTYNRECILGKVMDGKMVLNEMGNMVAFTRDDLPEHNPYMVLDEFIFMLNHVHGIILIDGNCRGGVTPPYNNVPTKKGTETVPLQGRTLGQIAVVTGREK